MVKDKVTKGQKYENLGSQHCSKGKTEASHTGHVDATCQVQELLAKSSLWKPFELD